MRNVKFTAANLSGVDLTDADWFNASGLLEGQIRQVRRETLVGCPEDIDGVRRELGQRYALPFSEWTTRVQRELLDTRQEYLRPGGLRDVTRNWKADS